ncbi:MAG: hypothetical protein ABSD29_08960 [Verrucomicrobiota bacterium]|jgi:hypothetical protein
MDDEEKANTIAKLKKSNPEETARLCKHYEDIIEKNAQRQKLDADRIAGLLKANMKAMGLDKRVTPAIPKRFKPGRTGGNPDTN